MKKNEEKTNKKNKNENVTAFRKRVTTEQIIKELYIIKDRVHHLDDWFESDNIDHRTTCRLNFVGAIQHIQGAIWKLDNYTDEVRTLE